ncbi:hypothetical protein Csa_019011 [Cucumis sativus]|uniref:Uncharacterized protein n=1 Tax=Cucumis sativus TaxID=3659 RepID=A0A0A0KFH5_CUCSA|nr:hypothetical protein Csa_019011 [Cucumis sativus]
MAKENIINEEVHELESDDSNNSHTSNDEVYPRKRQNCSHDFVEFGFKRCMSIKGFKTYNSRKNYSPAGRALPERPKRKHKSDNSFIVKKIRSTRAKLCRFLFNICS